MNGFTWVLKSVQLWDKQPTAEEIQSAVLPETDRKVRLIPTDKAQIYLDTYGVRISYNGMPEDPRFVSELQYILDENGAPIFGDTSLDEPIYLI